MLVGAAFSYPCIMSFTLQYPSWSTKSSSKNPPFPRPPLAGGCGDRSEGRMPDGTNSLVEGSSLELFGELVLVGMECLEKMGLDVFAKEALVPGANAEEVGFKVTDFGTKLAAVGFSLLAAMVTVLE